MSKKKSAFTSQQRIIIPVLVIVFLLAVTALFLLKKTSEIRSFESKIKTFWQRKIQKSDTVSSKDDAPIYGSSYFGVLPCADCSGLETELHLRRTERGAKNGTFILVQTYQGKGVDQVYRGTWEATQVAPDHPKNTVYELHDTNDSGSWYFLRVDDTHLLMLDADKKEIDSDLNFTLTQE